MPTSNRQSPRDTTQQRERGSHCAQYIDVKYIENKKEKKGATNVERKKEE